MNTEKLWRPSNSSSLWKIIYPNIWLFYSLPYNSPLKSEKQCFIRVIIHNAIYILRRVWRYQSGNQNPQIDEEQTTQWIKEKGQKDQQRSTKHTYKTKYRVTRTPLKLVCSFMLWHDLIYFVIHETTGKRYYTENEVISMLEFHIDKIFVVFGGQSFQQIIHILMRTNYDPLLTDLFLCY